MNKFNLITELIMDDYTDGCKIKVTTYNPEKRGRILDRNGKVSC